MNKFLHQVGIKDENFELLKISELIAQQVLEKPMDGNHGEIHPKGEDFVESGVPFIMASDINNGDVDYTNCKFISVRQADALRKGFAKNGDVLVTHKATIGRTSIVNYDLHPYIMLTPQVTYYRILDKSKLNNHYLKYYFDSSLFQKTLSLWAGSGSTRAYLGITAQHNLPIILPPIRTQKKIAAVLSSYDALIENNKKQILTLEKLAEELFKEWFVRKRFPGYQSAEFEKGLPKNWEFVPLKTLLFEDRKIIKNEALSGCEIYLGLEHLSRRSISIHRNSLTSTVTSDKLIFQKRDILFGKIRPYLHKICLPHFNGICSSDTLVLKPKRGIYEAYALFTIFSDSFIELATISSKGTKMPRADWGFLENLEVPLPEHSILKSFQKQFDDIYKKIEMLLDINRKALDSKNSLLDRLISGELSIEKLKLKAIPSMQELEL